MAALVGSFLGKLQRSDLQCVLTSQTPWRAPQEALEDVIEGNSPHYKGEKMEPAWLAKGLRLIEESLQTQGEMPGLRGPVGEALSRDTAAMLE